MVLIMIIGLRNFFYRPEKTPQTAPTQTNPIDVLMAQVRLHAASEVALDEASRENQRLDAAVAALERATQQPIEEDSEIQAIMRQFKSPQ